MASQLGYSRRNVAQQLREESHSDALRKFSSLSVLAVEITAVSDVGRKMSHRNSKLCGFRSHDRAQGLIAMGMLVRVDVRRSRAKKTRKLLELRSHFGLEQLCVVERRSLVD